MVSNALGIVIIGFLRFIAYGYALQPRKMQLFWGSLLGALLSKAKLKTSVVNDNLRIAFPQDPARRQEIAKQSYRHLGNLILEILLLFGPLKKFTLKFVDLKGLEHLKQAREKGRGVIFLASHLGNWEVMGATGGVIAESDFLFVTKRLKPHWLHHAIEKGRLKCGVQATYEPKTLRDVLTHLKKNGTVGIVLDQYAGPPIGVRVPLFGIPVGTSMAVATLVKRTGAVLLPVNNYRTPEGRWDVEILPPLEWESHEDPHYELALNTAKYTSVIEKNILKHPEQWLWIHRRFKGNLSPLSESEWSSPRIRK